VLASPLITLNNHFLIENDTMSSLVGRVVAVLEVSADWVSVQEILGYCQDRSNSTLFEVVAVLQQLFSNGVIVRKIEPGGHEFYKKTVAPRLPEFHCELCKVQCNSYAQYEAHILGHQHVVNTHALRTGTRDRTQWFTCGLCHKRMNSPEQIATHMTLCCAKAEEKQDFGRLKSVFNEAAYDDCDHDFPDTLGCDCWYVTK